MKTGEIEYTIIHDSPARREDYASVSGSKLYPLGFGATRYGFVFELFLPLK